MAPRTKTTREEKVEEAETSEEATARESEQSFRSDEVAVCANDGKPAVVKTSDNRASTVYYCAECGTASQQAIVALDGTGG